MQRICGMLTVAVCLLVLIGWQFDWALLKSAFLGMVTMKPNTALGIGLLGLALLLPRRQELLRRLLCCLTLALASLSLAAYLPGASVPVHELLFQDDPQAVATLAPGLMSFFSAACLWLLAWSCTLDRSRSWQLGINYYVVGIAGFALLQTLLGSFGYPFEMTAMAVHTAALLILLSVGSVSKTRSNTK